jgi:hypothetical protein
MRLPADPPSEWYGESVWDDRDIECPICGAADARWCDEAKHAAEEREKA